MARRKYGKGSVYRYGNNKWRGQVYLDDGERITFTAKTKKEVENWVSSVIKEKETLPNGLKKNITYGEFIDDWLETKKYSVSEGTWSYYSQVTRDYIKPVIGKMRLKNLKRSMHLILVYSKLY